LYVIWKLIHSLGSVEGAFKKARLGNFWLSLLRRYRHVLRQEQVEWIVKAKEEGAGRRGSRRSSIDAGTK
jgi:hypothetical protein